MGIRRVFASRSGLLGELSGRRHQRSLSFPFDLLHVFDEHINPLGLFFLPKVRKEEFLRVGAELGLRYNGLESLRSWRSRRLELDAALNGGCRKLMLLHLFDQCGVRCLTQLDHRIFFDSILTLLIPGKLLRHQMTPVGSSNIYLILYRGSRHRTPYRPCNFRRLNVVKFDLAELSE